MYAILTLADGKKVVAKRGPLKRDHPEKPHNAIDPAEIVGYEQTHFTRWLSSKEE